MATKPGKPEFLHLENNNNNKINRIEDNTIIYKLERLCYALQSGSNFFGWMILQTKAIEQYFPAVLFAMAMLYKVVLTFDCR